MTIEARQIPITEGFFTWPSEHPQLTGGRCKTCGRYFFPKNYPLHKPGCLNQDVEGVLLSSKGKLRSFTWQHYMPPPPYKAQEPFVPYGIGMVELPEGLNVVGIMTGCQQEDLKTGMDIEVVVERLYTGAEGKEYLTWKFRPVQTEGQKTPSAEARR